MTDIVMEAQVAPIESESTEACPQEGCIRPFPHEGVRHRYKETKELSAAVTPVPAPAPVPTPPVIRPALEKRRPFMGPIEDQPTNHVLATLADGTLIAWDTCRRCNRRIMHCGCLEGPMEPEYITRWRNEEFPIGGATGYQIEAAVQAATLPSESSQAEPEPVADSVVDNKGATHICDECGELLYLQDSEVGKRAYAVKDDSNYCTVGELGIHAARPLSPDDTPETPGDEPPYGNDEPDAQAIADAEDAIALTESTPVQKPDPDDFESYYGAPAPDVIPAATIDPEVGF